MKRIDPFYSRILLVVFAIAQRVLAYFLDPGHAEVMGAEIGSLSTGLTGYLLGAAVQRRPGDLPGVRKYPSIPTFCFVLLALAVSGCARVNPNWPRELIGCAVDSAPGATLDVSRVLLLDAEGTELSPAGRAEMRQLASRWGGKTVACAADALVRELRSAEPSPGSADAISRCRSFLDGIGVKGGGDAVRQQRDEGWQRNEGRLRRQRHERRQGKVATC